MSWLRTVFERFGLRRAEAAPEPTAPPEPEAPLAKVIPLGRELVREVDADLKHALRKVREES